jgi:hypothetical protein
MDVTMPDGVVVKGVPDGTTKQQVMERYKKSQGGDLDAESTTPQKGMLEKAGDVATGVGDFARSAATGTGANIAGGLMGAATLGTNALGLTHDDPVAMIRKFQSMAYQPETETGKKIAGAASAVGAATTGKLSHALGESTFKATGSPLEATVAELMPDTLMTIMGAKAPSFVKEAAMKGAGELAKKAVFNKTKDQAFKSARTAAFKVSPSETGGTIGRTIAGIGGKAEVERTISASNEQRVVELAKDDMQIPETAPLDRGSYAAAKFRASQPYQEGRQLGRMPLDAPYLSDVFNSGKQFAQVAQDFSETDLARLDDEITQLRGKYIVPAWDASSAIDQMSYLREKASDLFRSESATDRKLGFVHRDLAEALEDRLFRHATSVGKPELAAKFQQARRQLAKIHTYEDATNLDTGRISARSLVAQREAKAGRVDPFTDNLKLIADSAGAFPKSFQQMDAKGRFGPITVFEWMALVGGATTAAAGSKLVGAGIVAGAVSREAARAGASSKMGQAMMRPPSYKPGPIRRAAMAGGPSLEAGGAATGAESGNQ